LIAVISDLEESGERIYNLLKSRVEIEVMFDAFKNVLNADRTYMRDDYQMEGGAFINFIALVFYYRLYRSLADNSLLKRYTPNDVLISRENSGLIRVNYDCFLGAQVAFHDVEL